MGWLTLATTALKLLVSLYEQFWSDSAVLGRLKTKLAVLQARQQSETQALKDTYTRIEAEPHQTGQELADQLNKSIEKLRGKP